MDFAWSNAPIAGMTPEINDSGSKCPIHFRRKQLKRNQGTIRLFLWTHLKTRKLDDANELDLSYQSPRSHFDSDIQMRQNDDKDLDSIKKNLAKTKEQSYYEQNLKLFMHTKAVAEWIWNNQDERCSEQWTKKECKHEQYAGYEITEAKQDTFGWQKTWKMSPIYRCHLIFGVRLMLVNCLAHWTAHRKLSPIWTPVTLRPTALSLLANIACALVVSSWMYTVSARESKMVFLHLFVPQNMHF